MIPTDPGGILFGVLVLLTLGWIVWMVLAGVQRMRMAAMQAELQGRLLERLGSSSQELVAYLGTDAGQRLLQAVTPRADPAPRILAAIRTGVIVIIISLGFLVVYGILAGEPSRQLWLILAVLGFALGAGFLIASGFSLFLSRTWGLLERGAERK
jgi:hypothetical protein